MLQYCTSAHKLPAASLSQACTHSANCSGNGSVQSEPLKISADFPTDFVFRKLAGKVADGDHMTVGCCMHYKFDLVTKCLNCEDVTVGTL